jgi:hypothetical protein
MTISSPVYATREDVKAALDFKETARNNGQIDQAIESASRDVEALLRRRFYPQTATRYFDWPDYQRSASWRLWLQDNEVISLSALSAGGTTIAPADYFLEPVNQGPPFNRIEINLGGTSSFSSNASTYQRSIVATGVFGYQTNDVTAGALSGAINSSVTTLNCTNSALVGVGSLIKLDSERMLVTDKAFVTTSQTLQGNLTALRSNETVPVSTGSAYAIGETILIDTESMLVTAVSGNNLTVTREWDGSTLAAHSTGATVYAPRTLTVSRGSVGTTAASHLDAAAIAVHQPPSLVRELTIAEALNYLLQRQSGYARIAGQDTQSRGLDALRCQAKARYGRQQRTRAI